MGNTKQNSSYVSSSDNTPSNGDQNQTIPDHKLETFLKLMNSAQNIYQKCLEINPNAHKVMREVGITSGELAVSMGLGWIDGKSFKETLTVDQRKECMEMGLFGVKHRETAYEALSFPLFHDNRLKGFAVWKAERKKKELLGGQGISNQESLNNHRDILLVDSFQLYVTLRQVGYSGTVFLPFPDGYSLFQMFNTSEVEVIYVTSRRDSDRLLKSLDNCQKEIKVFSLPQDNESLTESAVEKSLEEAKLYRNAVKKDGPKKTIEKGYHIYKFESVTYRVKPLNLNSASLKVLLTAQSEDEKFTDRVDLYIASSRRIFAKSCSTVFLDDASLIESDLHKVIEEMEIVRDNKETAEVQVKSLTDKDEVEAKAVMSNKNILDEFVSDMRSVGFVGESQNLKLGLLVSVSRLLDKPLSVIVQSSSGSGKSHLLNTICSITPPESVIFMSKLTPSSLYYMPDLRHRLLCVDEAHGSQDALYPLRTLQSNNKLVLALPLKDAASGSTITKQIQVQGPVSFIESTTSDKLHPENASRAIILKMDESPEQTFRILDAQRVTSQRGYIDKSEDIQSKWRNVQRLISKSSLPVVIPFAHLLKFPTGPNARRDNQKLLSLIKAVVLLMSQQRVISNDSDGEYVEATIDDYSVAYSLYKPLLTTSQDELSARARDFLKTISDRDRTPFTRRQIMEENGISHSKVVRCIKELLEQEIIVEELTPKGQASRFVLLDTYIPDLECKGLATPEEVQLKFKECSSGKSA